MKKLIPIVLALVLLPSIASAAIVFDASTTVAGVVPPTTVLTWNHTVTSTANGILFVYASNCDAGDPGFTASDNGTQMTLLQKSVGTAAWGYLFYLLNPPSGVNNLSSTWSHSTVCTGAVASSYAGVNQVPPEVVSTSSVASASSITGSLTTLSDNDWTIIGTRSEGGGTQSAGAGTTKRVSGDINESIADSNGPIATAKTNTSLTIQATASGAWSDVMAAFAPALPTAYVVVRGGGVVVKGGNVIIK